MKGPDERGPQPSFWPKPTFILAPDIYPGPGPSSWSNRMADITTWFRLSSLPHGRLESRLTRNEGEQLGQDLFQGCHQGLHFIRMRVVHKRQAHRAVGRINTQSLNQAARVEITNTHTEASIGQELTNLS